MNLTQITAFRAVMTSRSMSDAARSLGRTQPAVSLAIRGLEEDLGFPLFERRGRQMIPVPEAQYLLAESEEILERLSVVSKTMRSFADGTSGALLISSFPGVSAYLLPRFAARFAAGLKGVTLTLTSRSSRQIEELARSQSIDFGFCDAPVSGEMSLRQYAMEILQGACFLCIHRDHPLAKHDTVTVSDLKGLTFGGLQSSHQHQIRLSALFGQQNMPYRVAIESQTFIPLLQFVRQKQCVAIVDPLTVINECSASLTEGEVVFRRLLAEIRYDYAILTPLHRPLSRVARRARRAWRQEIWDLLEAAAAHPTWLHPPQTD